MKKTIEELKAEPLRCPWGNGNASGRCDGDCMALTTSVLELAVPDGAEKMECALTLSALSGLVNI